MKLIIVESPTKSKTIEKFLGSPYKIESSYGHVKDLPKKKLGVDPENNFKADYIVPPKAKDNIGKLKKAVQKSGEVILATDEDREGEAIAYHLSEVLDLDQAKRIVFHEITKKAIKEALLSPRKINMDLVEAQQARRILDRLVGYKLSPLLWKKIMRGLSAGRVQSAAVLLIAEREKEIEKFKPEEYWTIETLLAKKKEFKALLIEKNNKKISKIKNSQEAKKITEDLKKLDYKVEEVKKKEIKRNPLPPFTTSTLQQEAWNKMRFSAKATMITAQTLYEKGYITYHRTDSFNLSKSSQETAKKLIIKDFGEKYWPGYPRNYKTKSKSAQEAHEAIRPTSPKKRPGDSKLNSRQNNLYKLIWQRFVASQMSQARFDSSRVNIKAGDYTLRASGQTLKFDGFLKVYPLKTKETKLPSLEKGDQLKLKEVAPLQHFTQPPARYNEASLVKTLEKEGIGRPSTYALIIDTIQRRNYVRKNEEKRFEPTEIGKKVNDLLVRHFPAVVNLKFTAEMEKKLDKIAQGKAKWTDVLKRFYQPFIKNLKNKEKEITKVDLTEKVKEKCPECGAPLLIRWGRFGRFYACSNFPNCKYTRSLEKPKLGVKCPKCKKGELIEKRTGKGKIFYACNQYPQCDYALWDKPTGEKCPRCKSLLVKKGKSISCSKKDCNYKKKK